MPLYPRLLAGQFASLPSNLQSFHQTLPNAVQGYSRVMRAAHGPSAWGAWLLGLPASGRRIPLRLEVAGDETVETWQRWFGDKRLVTTQFARRGYLVERAGVMCLWFRLTCERGRMVFRSQHASMLGIPLPSFLRPHVQAVVRGSATGWVAKIIIRSSWRSTLVRYRVQVQTQ